MQEKMVSVLPPVSCPDCGGDLMGYRNPELETLIWACRSCGSTFAFDEKYELQPYLLEIYYPACPGCGNSMVAGQDSAGGQPTRWICKACGEEIYI